MNLFFYGNMSTMMYHFLLSYTKNIDSIPKLEKCLEGILLLSPFQYLKDLHHTKFLLADLLNHMKVNSNVS